MIYESRSDRNSRRAKDNDRTIIFEPNQEGLRSGGAKLAESCADLRFLRRFLTSDIQHQSPSISPTMSASETSLRLNFLKQAAIHLSSQSPSIAAHLGDTHNRIVLADLKPLKPRHHENFCAACGSPRRPESSRVTKVQRNVAPSKTPASSAVIYECLRCHKKAVKPVQQPNNRNPNPSNASAQTAAVAASPSLPVQKSSTDASTTAAPGTGPSPAVAKSTLDNVSSKRRAKLRKQSGLQALLASKQRSQASSSSSLDLLDFLQQ